MRCPERLEPGVGHETEDVGGRGADGRVDLAGAGRGEEIGHLQLEGCAQGGLSGGGHALGQKEEKEPVRQQRQYLGFGLGRRRGARLQASLPEDFPAGNVALEGQNV